MMKLNLQFFFAHKKRCRFYKRTVEILSLKRLGAKRADGQFVKSW